MTNESDLTRNERVEILNELNKLFPVQVLESMYLQGVEKKRVENMIKEKFDEWALIKIVELNIFL